MIKIGLQEEIRDDLDIEVFGEFGKVVTRTVKGSPVYNSRGEIEDYTSAATSITVVPYNITQSRESQQRFGDLQEGDMDVAIRYDQEMNIGDYMTIEGINYVVKNYDPNFLPDNVVTIIRITKTLDEINA